MEKTYCEYCKKMTESIISCTKGGCICSECKNIKKKDTADYIYRNKQNKIKLEKIQKLQKQHQLNQIIQENKEKGIPACPNCGSTAIEAVNRGFSLLTGFVGSGKTLNYCKNCGHKWDPKKK